ncbi:MAG: hypothetical protein O9294_18170, partial [Cytophagales bacterium]|nr:hypothetical protein [Cytophagales bacterium]
KLPAANSMFLQWCRDELAKSFYLRSTFLFRGQEPASKRHHCRNTNVGGKHFWDELFSNIGLTKYTRHD